MVMQHFSGKDFLVMSEVSKSWNKRVKAGIDDKTILNLTKKLSEIDDIKAVTREEQTSKAISMDREAFSRIGASLFADTIESLIITDEEPENQLVNFPKLKKLEFYVTRHNETFSWISQLRLEGLEELKISSDCDSDFEEGNHDRLFCDDYEGCANVWFRFFNSMKNLKHLDLDNCCAKIILRMLNQAEIQLETLRCQKIKSFHPKFFEKLKTLTLDDEFPPSNVFGALKELTTLELHDFIVESFNEAGRPLPVNKSIKKLSISFDIDVAFDMDGLNAALKIILKACPSLETFFITHLTSEVMRFISCTNLKLKSLKFDEIEGGTLEEYEQMRQGINREIQFNI